MNRLDRIEETQLRKNIPRFQPGDTFVFMSGLKSRRLKNDCKLLRE